MVYQLFTLFSFSPGLTYLQLQSNKIYGTKMQSMQVTQNHPRPDEERGQIIWFPLFGYLEKTVIVARKHVTLTKVTYSFSTMLVLFLILCRHCFVTILICDFTFFSYLFFDICCLVTTLVWFLLSEKMGRLRIILSQNIVQNAKIVNILCFYIWKH